MFGFSLWLVSLFRELSLFAVYFPPCHSARSQRRSRRIHIPKLTLALRERGTVAYVGWGPWKSTFPKTLNRPDGNRTPGRSFFSFLKCRFCNSRQALRAEWHESEVEIKRKTQFIKVWSYKRQDKNRSCLILNTWINQKKMYPASSKTHTHSNRFLLGWYVWSLYKVGFSIPRTFTLRNILPTLSFCAKPKAKT